MGDGLIGRMLRALRLDPTLYREVAAPGASTWQAALVVLLTAAAAGVEGVRVSASGAGLIAISHMAAWPVWAAGLWLVGVRLRISGGEASEFGQVARAIAFAQTPGVFFALSPFPLWTLGPLGGMVRSLVLVWVLVGTFFAVRESLGLSNGRTLSALFAVGAAIAVLLGPLVVFATVWAFLPQHSVGEIVVISHRVFDFNLGLGLISAVAHLILPAAIELIA